MPTSKPTKPASPEAMRAADAAPKARHTNYPEPFAARVAGREKRPLGEVFGLSNFGVNLTLRQAWGEVGVSAIGHNASGGYYGPAFLTTSGHPDN